MSARYTPGSFTKNFSWQKSYGRLHTAIRRGFSGGLEPLTRDAWRQGSGIVDPYRQLIPLNFFLYSIHGTEGDFVLVDRLVEVASNQPYNKEFAQLALFAFHLARSGNWRQSKWSDGRVAGWANEFVRKVAWKDGAWSGAAFEDTVLKQFIERRIEGQPVTKRKVLTNYRYMLESAGVTSDGAFQPVDLRQRWLVDAVQLFWDREIFDGTLSISAGQTAYEHCFMREEVHKLLGCDEPQGMAFVRAAYREYSAWRGEERSRQLRQLGVGALFAARIA